MGRTVPTFRQLIEETANRWSKFRRALRREDQECFDHLFNRARCYTQAGVYQCSDNPMETILLSIALDQERRLRNIERLLGQAEALHAISRLDSGHLPLSPGDSAMASDEKSDHAQTD